ncbi:MAG TPA: radical SAM protein [Methanotrichaceae archaeon]|nr:radical SAM protein [Methanotrichaceae archaeon]
MAALFCQNYEISQDDLGEEISAEHLARIMVHLQRKGCHNINLVTPTHFVPQILEARIIASGRGLKVPLVYNCGGYESVETLRLLEGIVDIYMPDMKYGSDDEGLTGQAGQRYSNARDYARHARAAIEEMHRQAGDLVIEDGLAVRGLIVRHLVLPEGIAGTREVVEFLSGLSKDTYLNVMAQYHPAHEADQRPELSRRITAREFGDACNLAIDAGLTRGLEIQ